MRSRWTTREFTGRLRWYSPSTKIAKKLQQQFRQEFQIRCWFFWRTCKVTEDWDYVSTHHDPYHYFPEESKKEKWWRRCK